MEKKNIINSNDFKLSLNKGLKSSIFAFLGEEDSEKRKVVNKISDIFYVNVPVEDRSVQHFFLQKNSNEGDNILKIAEHCLSQSMFYTKKLTVIYNFDLLTNKEENLVLNEIIKDLPDDDLLILISEQRKIPSAIGKNLVGKIQPVIFWRHFESQLVTYIKTVFEDNQVKIDLNLAKIILRYTGNDLGKIDNAVNVLINSTTDNVITIDHVKKSLSDDNEISIFEFIDELFNKNKNSFYLLKKVLDQDNHELVVLSLVVKELERLEKFYLLAKKNIPASEIIKSLNLPYKGSEKFLNRTRNFSLKKIKKIFPLVAKADILCKSEKKDSFLNNPLFDLIFEIIR